MFIVKQWSTARQTLLTRNPEQRAKSGSSRQTPQTDRHARTSGDHHGPSWTSPQELATSTGTNQVTKAQRGARFPVAGAEPSAPPSVTLAWPIRPGRSRGLMQGSTQWIGLRMFEGKIYGKPGNHGFHCSLFSIWDRCLNTNIGDIPSMNQHESTNQGHKRPSVPHRGNPMISRCKLDLHSATFCKEIR